MKWFYNLKISAKLIISFILVALLAGIVGIYGTINMSKIEKSDLELYENMTVPMSYLAEISEYFQRIRVESRDAIIYNDKKGIEESIGLIEEYREEINKSSKTFEKTILTQEYKNAYNKFLESRINYGNELNNFYKLVRENKDKEAFELINEDMKVAANAERTEIDNLITLKAKHAKTKSDTNISTANKSITIMISLVLIAMMLAIALGIFISKIISTPVKKTLTMIQEMQKGHLNERLNMNTTDEIGKMAKGMDEFADDLKNNVVNAMKRISNGDININIEAKDNKDEISPAIKTISNTLGILINEMNNMAKQHNLGDIDVTVDENKFQGAYKEMAVSINSMVNGHITVKKKAMACIAEFGNGNFEAEIETFPGKKIFINNTIETLRTNLKNVRYEIKTLITASEEGKLSERANDSIFQGDWALLIKGLNGLLDKIIEPVKEASSVLKEMSNGNLKVSVTGDYKGDHAEIKNTLNFTIETISSYINELSKVLNEMSNGNLDLRIDRKYLGDFTEIKDSLNMIIDSFNEIMGEINQSAEQVSVGSDQLSQSSQTLSQGSTEQASSIEEITSSIEEISSQTKENDKNASQASTIALTSKDDAISGNKQMQEMLNSMGEINESSTNISKIIKVIDEIAFQTNILALNAAVEAARAGQHGKGFAVVAEEVRNLAARSANAAKETTSLIEGSIKKVDSGSKIANDTAQALDKIVSGVAKVADIVGGIAIASNEQLNAITQVNKAIEQVSQVTQTNSATAQESASSSEELSLQASTLKETVSKFKIKNYNSAITRKNINKNILDSIIDSPLESIPKNSDFALAGVGNSAKSPKIILDENNFGKY
ncbi:MAG: methyl-accepting chemotaxis protein [Clostridiales bacterium]